ncbi:MAG: DUF2309 domain-containing protein [Leptospirales bacterium]
MIAPAFFIPEDPARRNLVIELRARIRLALGMMPDAWPMETFIHHNPLNGLEDMSFEEAVSLGESLFAGKGYPDRRFLRESFRRGRLTREDLLKTLPELIPMDGMESLSCRIGDRTVSFGSFCAAQLLISPDLPTFAPEDSSGQGKPFILSGIEGEQLSGAISSSLMEMGMSCPEQSIRERMIGLAPPIRMALSSRIDPLIPDIQEDPIVFLEREMAALGARRTFSDWMDRLLGSSVREQVDRILCDSAALFLDEGQAFWSLPVRDRGFFALFRERWSRRPDCFAESPGLSEWFRSLPESAEETLLHLLERWGVPKSDWVSLFAHELALLPGWAGTIKWRSEHLEEIGPSLLMIQPSEWLALRLALEAFFVETICSRVWGVSASRPALLALFRKTPEEYCVRWMRQNPDLPGSLSLEIDRIEEVSGGWGRVPEHWKEIWSKVQRSRFRACHDGSDILLSCLKLMLFEDLHQPEEGDHSWVPILMDWLARTPFDNFGMWGLLAYEKSFKDGFLGALSKRQARPLPVPDSLEMPGAVSPSSAQVLFCIDVRSEGVRRHLERNGNYETIGLAGFFGLPLRFRGFGTDHVQTLAPAIVTPRHLLWELHRPYQMKSVRIFFRGRRWFRWLNHLIHEMKNNVVTPYVFVEAIGWMSGLPLFGKTFLPGRFHRLSAAVERLFLPNVSTVIPLDKISEKEAREIVLTEERNLIRQVLLRKWGEKIRSVPQGVMEEFRFLVMTGDPRVGRSALGRFLSLSPEEESDLIRQLREVHQMNSKRMEHRLEELSRMGLSFGEQVAFAETALTLAGLIRNFSRLVVFVGHRSTSDNNPYESALDCGACGGQDGTPNARVVATLLNRIDVRVALAKRGIHIPGETWFMAGVHDTTTDSFRFFDAEDWPSTHEQDIRKFTNEIAQAGLLSAAERLKTLPGGSSGGLKSVSERVYSRSHDWAEVRPEWGLSGNAAFLIGKRAWTRGLDLSYRVFLQEYDDNDDPSGNLLETLMSGPLVVGRWISLEHYFSTVDNEVYGSGSKVSHNVVGRFGVQFGNGGDLRIGLPRQTVAGERHFRHEPMRLLTVVAAGREKVHALLRRNLALRDPFDRRWALLVVRDQASGVFWQYHPGGEWVEWSAGGEGSPGSIPAGSIFDEARS